MNNPTKSPTDKLHKTEITSKSTASIMFATGSCHLPTLQCEHDTSQQQYHRNTRLDEVDGILDMAEQVLDGNLLIDIDPIPIASSGVNIVDSLPLSRVHTDLYDDPKLFDLLSPMIKKRKIQDFSSSTDCCFPTSFLPSFAPSCDHFLGNGYKPSLFNASMLSDGPALSEERKNNDFMQNIESENPRFRPYQSEVWGERLQELCDFRAKFGHCLVPHNWSGNTALAQWVKRQRYQHKLKQEGRHSTLSDERLALLEEMGFVWDSHKAAWEERLNELRDFRKTHGHCNVPSTYDKIPPLAVWVKCQRRQYKLFIKGEKSTMTQERIAQLDSLGFSWNPRRI